jgi:hypothetical protein
VGLPSRMGKHQVRFRLFTRNPATPSAPERFASRSEWTVRNTKREGEIDHEPRRAIPAGACRVSPAQGAPRPPAQASTAVTGRLFCRATSRPVIQFHELNRSIRRARSFKRPVVNDGIPPIAGLDEAAADARNRPPGPERTLRRPAPGRADVSKRGCRPSREGRRMRRLRTS